jgi:hypothetical protein
VDIVLLVSGLNGLIGNLKVKREHRNTQYFVMEVVLLWLLALLACKEFVLVGLSGLLGNLVENRIL